MTTAPLDHLPRRSWRIVLLILVLLPFLPEVAILASSGLAAIGGCHLEDKATCLIGPLSPSAMIAVSLSAGSLISLGFGFGLAAVWLALCFLAVSVGWTRLSSRLLLAAAVAIVFAILPYIAPALAAGALTNPQCQPNEGGVGACVIYGVDIDGAAHDTVTAVWLLFLGAPIAAVAYVIYAIVIIVMRAASGRRKGAPAPEPAGR